MTAKRQPATLNPTEQMEQMVSVLKEIGVPMEVDPDRKAIYDVVFPRCHSFVDYMDPQTKDTPTRINFYYRVDDDDQGFLEEVAKLGEEAFYAILDEAEGDLGKAEAKVNKMTLHSTFDEEVEDVMADDPKTAAQMFLFGIDAAFEAAMEVCPRPCDDVLFSAACEYFDTYDWEAIEDTTTWYAEDTDLRYYRAFSLEHMKEIIEANML